MSQVIISPSLVTIPVELVYRILDHICPQQIMLSLRGVCQRLNDITDTYAPYRVKFNILRIFYMCIFLANRSYFPETGRNES